MRLAVLSDIHSNLEALQACLAHARARGAQQFAFTGDIVGYGADPDVCLDIVAELMQKGAIAVQGNHDAASVGGLCETMEFTAREAVYWTRTQLSAEQKQFLHDLPLTAQLEDLFFVHACAEMPAKWTYITGARQAERCMQEASGRVTFSGHVHHPTLYYRLRQGSQGPQVFYPKPNIAIPLLSNRQWLSIVGSVGQPRDGNPASSYALFDQVENTLTFYRVAYDYHAAARKILAAGLPPRLAHRLEHGE